MPFSIGKYIVILQFNMKRDLVGAKVLPESIPSRSHLQPEQLCFYYQMLLDNIVKI